MTTNPAAASRFASASASRWCFSLTASSFGLHAIAANEMACTGASFLARIGAQFPPSAGKAASCATRASALATMSCSAAMRLAAVLLMVAVLVAVLMVVLVVKIISSPESSSSNASANCPRLTARDCGCCGTGAKFFWTRAS